MPELPFHLKTLEPLPGALDIIRYLGALDEPVADIVKLCGDLNLTDRTFSKAIRRLVTKGYVQMDGDQVYRLTDHGKDAAEELSEYDLVAPDESDDSAKHVLRRLVVALPQKPVAGSEAALYVGFDADEDQGLENAANMVLRVSAINGEVTGDEMLELSNAAAHNVFKVTPAAFTKMRVRIEAYQLNPFDDGIEVCGGLYVDVDVAGTGGSAGYVAYGTDVSVMRV